MKKKIFIIGGCVSRDTLNYANNFELVHYYARTSLISAFSSKKFDEDVDLSNIESNFQKKMVRQDLVKDIKNSLKESDFDILLIDFLGERFDLGVTKSGQVYTKSSEFIRSGLGKASDRIIKSGTDEQYELWVDALGNFMGYLKEISAIDKVIVNQVYWAKNYLTLDSYDGFYSEKYLLSQNVRLELLYSEVKKYIKDEQFFLNMDLLVSAESHRWGVAPFHYIDDYYNSLAIFLEMTTVEKDYATWGGGHAISESEIELGLLSNGVNVVEFKDGTAIDIYVQNIEKTIKYKKIIVSFSGAVVPRESKIPPFFSGLGISKSVDAPLIAISDPTLDLNSEISLAWYAGNRNFENLQSNIAKLIDTICEYSQCLPILMGGSGGGFASLAISTLLDTKSYVFVWNPQTSISKYAKIHVEKYLEVAFPKTLYNDLEQVLSEKVFIDNLTLEPLSNKVTVLYLQNATDWHVKKHADPFVKINKLGVFDSKNNFFCNKNINYILCDFGEGHAAPSKVVIKEALNALLNNAEFDNDTASNLRSAIPAIKYNADNIDFSVSCDIESGVLRAEIITDNMEKYKYAFYYVVNGEKVFVRGYSSDNTFEVKLLNDSSECLIAYLMNPLGVRLIKKVIIKNL